MAKEEIREWGGRLIGTIEDDGTQGDKLARDFYGRILGWYKKKYNHTTDFYGRVLTTGNTLSALIYKAEEEAKRK